MSHEDRFDLDREERIARVLRRQPRDRSVPPYAAVESRLRSRVPAPVAVLAGAAVIVLAAVLGAALAERRGGVGEPSPSASAPPGTASASPSLTATPAGATATPTPSVSPTPTPIALPSSAQISAPSRDVVWALVGGSRLFVSTDRGDTWHERRIPEPVRGLEEVSFVSEREGWAMSAPDTECDTHLVRLWHTSDGANTWDELPATAIPAEQCKASLSFIHATAGFLSVWGANEASATLQTTDGGRTWRAIPIPDPPGFDSSGFRGLRAGRVRPFGTALFVDAVADVGEAARRRFTLVWNSNAPGWSYLAEVPNARDAFVFVGGRGGGDLRWLLISGPGGSQESTDSGQTWHPFETDYQQAAPVAPVITFADGSVGYATVRGAIQRTTDGGRHWEAIKTPGT